MLSLLKKKSDTTETPVEAPVGDGRDLSAFIPYYAHYNPHTVLTKNGELLQIIRISHNNQGLTYESGSSNNQTLREDIRKAITQAITSDSYAVWIHTIRRRKNVRYRGHFSNPFAAYMQAGWQKKYLWKYQYYNEVYLSILHTGQSGTLLEKKGLQHVMLPKSNRKYRNAFLDRAAAELDGVIAAILLPVREHYQAERLSLVERSTDGGPPIFYSEPMELLGTLLNLRTEQFPVYENDISREISTHTLTFGFNALEAKAMDHKRFAALLSLKQYREVPPSGIDRLLQSPLECIVSQSFVFIPAARALKDYKTQKDLYDISGDRYSIAASGISEMLQSNRGLATDFGQLQTIITIMSDEYKNLDGEVLKAQQAFGDMGLITVREDLKLEECFWSQLPGNFEFIRRKDIIPTSRIGGFCRLNLYPDGHDTGNHWGEAIALMPTQVNSPYFFNFHSQDNGHTLIFDFNSFRDSFGHVLTHFLLTSATKYNGKMFIFDRQHASYLWCDKTNGNYHRFQSAARRPIENALHLNPFSLDDTKRNRGFLLTWCINLIDPHFALTEEHHDMIQTAIDRLYENTEEPRSLQALIDIIGVMDYKLANAFYLFCGNNKYAGVFDAASETLDLNQGHHVFDMGTTVKNSPHAVSLFAYLLHRIILTLDGKPCIIVLREGIDLLDNNFFAPRLESLMEMLKQNNVALICTTQSNDANTNNAVLQSLLQTCATQLVLPDDINLDYTARLPHLTAHDHALLDKMERRTGDFLLKQNNESIALRVNLDGMEDIKAVFANDAKTLIAAGGKFASLPKSYKHADD